MAAGERQKTFHSSLRYYSLVAVLYLAASGFLMWDVWRIWNTPQSLMIRPVPGAPLTYDPIQIGLLILRIVVALYLLTRVLWKLWRNASCTVVIMQEEVVCTRGSRRYSFPYEKSLATYSPMLQKRFRVISLTCGERSFFIESLYYPDFALIERVLIKALDRNFRVPFDKDFKFDEPAGQERKLRQRQGTLA